MIKYFYIAVLILLSSLTLTFQSCDSYQTPLTENSASNSESTTNYTLIADPTLQARAAQILNSRCSNCHVGITNGPYLYDSGWITPGNPTRGRLILSMQEGSMPPNGSMAPGELQSIRDWVASMSIVFN